MLQPQDPSLFAVWDIINTAWGSPSQDDDTAATLDHDLGDGYDGGDGGAAPANPPCGSTLALEDGRAESDSEVPTTQPEQTPEEGDPTHGVSMDEGANSDVEMGTQMDPDNQPVDVMDSQCMDDTFFMDSQPLEPEFMPMQSQAEPLTMDGETQPGKHEEVVEEPKAELPNSKVESSMPPPPPVSPGKIKRRREELAVKMEDIRLPIVVETFETKSKITI